MDVFLHAGPRPSWLPELAGVTRCSRTEIHDDIEFIHANLPFNAAQAAAQQQQAEDAQEGMQEEGDDSGEGGAASAAAAAVRVNLKRDKRKMTKNERLEADLDREAAASKRARLQHKIAQERHRLETTKESGYNLRQTLDALRAETQQYEDAIAQTKREMEMIQRETQILEERLQQSRSEYHWGLDQADRIRVEEEKIETILREKLSHVNTQVNDVSDRVHQLRQLEEEFKLKDVRIQQLETECSKYETQIQLLDQLITKQISGGAPASSTAGVALPTTLASPGSAPAVPAPSPTPPSAADRPQVDPNSLNQVQASLIPAAPLEAQPQVAAPAAANASTEDVAMKSEDTAMTDVGPSAETKLEPQQAPAPSTEIQPPSTVGTITEPAVPAQDAATSAAAAPAAAGAPTASPPAVAASASPIGGSNALPGIVPLLPIPTGPNPSLSELLTSIHSSTTTIAHLTMTLKLHEEQLESSNRQLIDRDRAMKYMQEQIERFSNLNHELNYKLKQSENLTLEERAKLEQSYKQILFAQKQKDEQATIIDGYEMKLKVFEQLLNVADVRATGAEENVGEMLAELKSTRMSNQILQAGYNKLLREYERSVHEKYAAIEDAHKLAAQIQGGVKPPVHLRFDSSDSVVDPATAASSSPRGASVKHEVPHTPPRNVASSDDSGFGGINGLASPMDHDHSGGASASAYGSHKFEFNSAFNAIANSSPSSSTAAATPAGLQSFIAPDESSSAAVAAHYHKLNMMLTSQNRELSIRLNQMTHQNTQLQVALVKVAHRPAKPSSTVAMTSAAVSPLGVTSSPQISSPHAPLIGHSPTHAQIKNESALNGHSYSSGATAMDLSSSSVPALATSGALQKQSSGHSHRASATSSPLQTPKSPLPPLHPNKPVFHEGELDL